MAVVGNTASEIGDVIQMQMTTPITGNVSFNSFTDITVGVTGTRFWIKYFRYSLDGGINWNLEGYIPLTNAALLTITVNWTWDVLFDFRYTRGGTDSTGLLEYNGTVINTTTIPYISGSVYDKSIFHFFFPTNYHPDLLDWSLNVDKKLYAPGIVPLSLERGDNQNAQQEDRDYIDTWRTITHYFALLVGYARKLNEYRNDKRLLIDFLRQRGVFLCENQSLIDLQYIQENYWDEMRHRGTSMISKPKGTLVNGLPKSVDGELLRLICYNSSSNEFLFSISEFNNFGWIINDWSPIWQGTTHSWQLNKLWEKSPYPIDLSKYPIHNPSNVSLVVEPTLMNNVFTIENVASGESAGIGIDGGIFNSDYSTNINKDLTYELDMMVKVSNITPTAKSPLSIQLFGYSVLGVSFPFGTTSSPIFTPTPISLDKVELVPDVWTNVKIILRGNSYVYNPDLTTQVTSLNAGVNLKTINPDTCKFIPQIFLDNTVELNTSAKMEIYNLSFKPAYTNYSTGFLNATNFIQTWIQNNQGSLTTVQIEKIMKFYLLPYSTILLNNYI